MTLNLDKKTELMDNFLKEMQSSEFSQDIIPILQSLTSIEIGFKMLKNKEPDIGISKIGGTPDLPRSIGWRNYQQKYKTIKTNFLLMSKEIEVTKEKPLVFVAQINLKDVKPYDYEGLLPEEGILYFFYSPDQNFKHPVVQYYNGSIGGLQKTEFPKSFDKEDRLKSFELVAEPAVDVPDYMYHYFKDVIDYESMLPFYLYFDDKFAIKMLGYPNFYFTYPNEFVDREVKIKKSYAKDRDWILLFQIGSIQKANLNWGDSGKLYYWIRREDLLNKQFDKVEMVLLEE